MCSSPRLIAACHVLHRLLMPRHSPCALSSLTSWKQVSLLPSESNPLRWASIRCGASRRTPSHPLASLRSLVLKNYAGFRFRFIAVCVTLLKRSTNYFVTSLLLALQFFIASLFSFQGADSKLLQAQIEMLKNFEHFNLISFGGDKRNRTADLLLARQALSQLSYTPVCRNALKGKWWAQVDSNHRPHDYQSCALAS